jgi:membrane protease YdiL (CAAX protease family)
MEPLTTYNVWIESITGAQRRLHAVPALILALAAMSFALLAAPVLYEALGGTSSGSGTAASPFSRAIAYLFLFTPLYLCAGLALLWEQRAPRRAPIASWKALTLGVAVGGLLFLLAVLGASVAGLLILPAASANDGLLIGVAFAAVLTAFQSYSEELFFRGWLQPIIATDWGLFAGLAVSSALFAIAHCVTQEIGLIAVINIALAGVMFGLMALRTGGVAAPFAAHATWNWLEQSVLGLAPNPGVDSLGSVVDVDLIGPGVLSGGTDGLNGSLLVTAVLAVAVMALLTPGLSAADRLKRQA